MPGICDYVLERGYAAECVTRETVRKSYGAKLFPSLECRKTRPLRRKNKFFFLGYSGYNLVNELYFGKI